jgi:hypothetical protein
MNVNIDILNCVIEPLNGRGGLFIGNVESAVNINVLRNFGINFVLCVC